jgi:hypothetical protein
MFAQLVDGTASDNKNNEMIVFLCWLVHQGYFQDASMFVQPKGHTFTVLDQSFNTMISQLLSVAIYTVSALLALMFNFLAPYNCVAVVELEHLWDWKEFFKPHVQRMGGFCTGQYGSGMHEFYARKDAHGAVRVWFRASSQASSWLPEGPGYLVFESVPVGLPLLAHAKADEEWGRCAVEGTLRAWYRFMTTDSEVHMAQIKAEWESRFNLLPAGGNTDLLPAARRLIWTALPQRSFLPRRPADGTGDGVTGALENPCVNPITGKGRSATDVQHDVHEHRCVVRSNAPAESPALFQADYLFVQLPGVDLALHRVVHGLLIHDATEVDIQFTCGVYHHLPQPGVAGFWGTFETKSNPLYDPKNPKKGTKFIRHHDVRRDVIRVYAVETFTCKEALADGKVKTVLRVTADSLQRLSIACPDYSMPSTIPDSHAAAAQGGQPRKKSRPREQNEEDVWEEEMDEGEDDASPPEVPDGFQEQAWTDGEDVYDFMVWTAIEGLRPSWHAGLTIKKLGVRRRDGFTHDAKLDGTNDIRGVTLSLSAHAEGCWICLARVFQR